MSTYTNRLATARALRLILIASIVGALWAIAGGATPAVQARYADGAGTGKYQNQIYWLEWGGFSFANGQSRTFNLPGGVTVSATVSNVSGGAITVGQSSDYAPAAMNLAYPNTGFTAIESCTACTNRFRLTFSANVAGTAVPVDLVAIDAEAAASNEYLKVTTDGNPWQLLEQFQAANLRATWSNGDKSLELHGNGSTTYGTVLAVSTSVTNFDFELKGGGISAAALGVFLPFDYGDAPASFNDAGHYIRQTFSGGLPGTTKVYDPVSTAFTNFTTVSDAPTVFLGAIKPDADPGSQNTGANAATALGDDINNTDDEDGVAGFPVLTRNTASYAVVVSAHNTSGASATLWGWVDFNGDGRLSANEAASAPVANGANPANVTLNWSAVNVTAAAGANVYARFRITTGALIDSGATPQDERAQGGAADGEVEDYSIFVSRDPINDAFQGCGVITFDNDAQGFRTASTTENRTVNSGPHAAPFQQGSGNAIAYFRWEGTGGNPSGHLRADDMDGEYQEVWTPVLTDPNFSGVIGQQIQFDYKNDTGYNQYRLYLAIVGKNGNQYYYYFNDQLGAVSTWSRVKVPMVASAWHTGFEASESPSTPPDSPAPSAAQFAAVLGNLDRFAISVEGVSGSDTSRFDNFGRACDYGDLPESGTSFVTTGANAARHNVADEVRLGARIDSEPTGLPNPQANGDDLNNLDDEDGVAALPPLPTTPANYALTVAVLNTSGRAGTVYGWIDLNGNSRFEPAELATAAVPGNGSVNSVALTWTNASTQAASTFARLRFTTFALTDNGATPADERAQGLATDGEVEDYRIQANDFGDAPKDMSSIDAALTNAYPTLLADNGPRHAVDTAIRLGAFIDNEPDGQPNLAANGDDTNNLADEDGVAFNPALGLSTANVILSGVSNNLVVTASVAGFVSVWIDYNQNGTFTDTGEQIFNDHAVTAGANALAFTTPNTAPHGATYMRFRYSTQRGVANTVTGAAPDGEVEDYRVEVTLPTPVGCEADLVNGSFEAPVGGGLYPSSQVPGWGFRATNPASGSGFDQRHIIEIWTNRQEGVPAYEGNQFAEINGYVAGALYQEMLTTPGQTMLWQFAHRGRRGTDVMALKIGAPGATVQVTQVTDGNSAWQIYKGSYTVPPGQTVTRFEFVAISSTGGDPSIGNFIDAVHFSLPCDFGDAPDTFGTTKGANGPNHLTADLLRLGALTDAEGTGFPGANADGDDLNNTDDEDSLATPLPPLNIFATSYSLTGIPVLNNTGSPASLHGWVDFNRNGVFDASEGVSTPVPSNAVTQTVNLAWSNLSGLAAGQSYVRLRLSPQSGLTATGPGGAGEVEDYPLTIITGGTVVVTKNTVGGNGSFPFTSTLPGAGSFSLATSANTASRTVGGVAPGAYSINETAPAGWTLTGATCSNGAPGSFTVAAGATVTCIFTNTQLSTLTVIKRTVGGDGSFSFTSTIVAAPSFTLTTTANRASRSFTDLQPGSYVINEAAPAGWDLTGATCDNGDAPGAITLGAGVSMSCTFTNTKRGSLTVVKETVGGDGVFTFTGSLNPASFQLTTTNGAAQRPFADLLPGTYNVTETVPAGWALRSATCSDGSDPASIGVAPGEDVTCTFRNEKLDTIVVINVALGGDAAFGYTSTVPGGSSFALTTTASSAYTYFVDVAAATYAISQTTTPAGWELAGAICSDGSDPSSITLTAGETIICTFINTKDDTIIVEKRTIGGDGNFPFTSTVPGVGSFGITTTNGVARTSITVTSPISTYSIVETVPQGWDLTGTTCDNGDSPDSITVGVGETVTCVFTDTQRSSLSVGKIALGSDAAFPFASTLNPSAFTLTTTNGFAVETFADLVPGTYAITETTPAGWDLVDALCSNGDDPGSVTLAPGEHVVCLFENIQRGALVIGKETSGGDGVFTFSSSTLTPASFTLTTTTWSARREFTNLAPGIYDVAETVPPGWHPGAATCSNGDMVSQVTIQPGATVTCTFANIKLAHLIVVKETIGGDGTFDLSSTTLTPANFSLTTTNGSAQRTFIDLQPGSYDVAETVPTGWDQTGAACSNGGAPDSVTLNAGDVVTCTLQNTKRGAVVVVKQAVGGDHLFHFASQTLSPSPFHLTTVSGTAQITFTNVMSGVYDVAETVPAGWDLATPVCSDGSDVGSIGVQPGETVTCTFTNTKRGGLTVVKHAVGGDGAFAFTSNAFPGNALSLATVFGAAQATTAPLVPGAYAVTETMPTGWDLTGASCSDGSSPASIAIGPGENVTCTFENTRRGSVIIVKNTVGGDGTFRFTSPTLGDFDLTTAGGNARRTFDNVLPGTHSVAESVPVGWDLTIATCSDGSQPDSIDLAPGEQVTCIFVDTKRASLTIVKNTIGGDGQFAFTSAALGSFNLTTLGGTARQLFTNLVPGSYDVAESVPAGWDLTGATCSDGSNLAAINLSPSENVTCIFVDTKRGSLTVVKNATGGDGQFDFTSNVIPGGAFSLVTVGGTGQVTTPPLLPGTYFVTETAPAGWRLDSATCSDGSAVDNIHIAPGEDVVCTFENLKLDTIVVVKRAVGGDDTFTFASTALGDFNLTTANGTAQRSFANLAPGSYDVRETAPAGWTPTVADPVCSNGDNASNITLAAGETAVCVFVNLKQDTLVVEKRTIGGDGRFAFASPQLGAFALTTANGAASRAFTGLQPGTYNISETAPTGWVQSGATCSDGSSPNSISLAPGVNVTCVFTNTKLSSISVVKRTVGGDATFTFAGSLGSFGLTTVGGAAQQSFPNLAAGTYAISETVPAGWDLTGATCSDGSDPASIDLAPGEDVTCSFVNTQRGSLTVVKNTVGGDGAFGFTSQALGGLTVNTSGGTGQRLFPNLVPGSYDLAETIPAGWRLESATCSDGSSPASVAVDPGENVTCTFTNLKLDTINVVKRAEGGDGVFTYTSQALGGFTIATVNGQAQRSFTDLAPGTYDVSESSQTGWTATEADPVCSNGDRASNIDLGAGQTVVCVFVNLKQDTIIVVKQSIGRDRDFAFGGSLGSFVLTTTNSAASQSFSGLSSGIYAITESVPAGWDQTSATCDNGDAPGAISLGVGETVRCTFVNTQRGSVQIVKAVSGADTTFNFTSRTLTPTTFSVTTAGGQGSTTLQDVRPGVYDVSEVSQAGWDLLFGLCSTWETPDHFTVMAGGETVCAFTNVERGSLAVVKQATGGDGAFAFTSQTLTPTTFSLATSGGAASRTFGDLVPGVYDVSETAQAGWDLTGATCSNGSPASAIVVNPGENVTCTFANVKRGGLTVVKQAAGGDGVFRFTSRTLNPASFDLTTSGGTAGQRFGDLLPGVYDVNEATPAGWDLASATCSNGTPVDAVRIAAGEEVTCTFVNAKHGSITVVKNTQGGEGTFSYSGGQLGNFRLTTSGGSAQRTFADLTVGMYSIGETPTKGWDLTNATCSDGSPVNAISLDAGESVTCTFTNVKRGALTVVKNASGGNGTFPFTSTALGSFNLTTVNGAAQQTFGNLVAGTYDLSEIVPSGWDLTSATCSDSSVLPNVAVAAGENVTCTFTNVKRGSLTVVKQATGSDTTFPFVSSALGAFNLATVNGSAQRTFGGLVPGSYDLSESVPAGWRQESATCSDGSTLPNVDVAPGEDVTCTFANTQLDTIIVVKRAVGGDGVFTYTSQALGGFSLSTANGQAQQSFAGLAPGSYSVAETAQAGWTPTVADPICSNGDPASAITLAAGETVVCVFVNLKQDTIVVEKRTVGGDGAFAFTSNLPGAASFALTTTNGSASRAFTNLTPATYNIAESAPAGWVQTGATCDNGANPTSISLAPGATVRCTFTNTQQSSITVVKQTQGGDGTFGFTGDLGAFDLATVGGLAQQRFTGLAAGTYSISESVPAGWDLTAATCSDGSSPASIDLAAGEDVTCVFANVKRGGLTVVKHTIGGDGVFTFTSQALGGFVVATANGSGQQAFGNLVPGVYDVTEALQDGWGQGAATCSDGSNPASVAVEPGEDVTCTFENTKLETIALQLVTVGPDATFRFASRTLTPTITARAANVFELTTRNNSAAALFTNLTPGTYDLSFLPNPGWLEYTLVCTDGSDPAAINLRAGELIVCTFVALRQDTIVVEKRTLGGDGVFGFTSTTLAPNAFSLATRNNVTSTAFTGLQPGVYDVSESPQAGWDQTGAACSDGSSPNSIDLAVGETVTCVFTNTQRSRVTVVKHVLGGDGSFGFGGTLGDFNLTTTGGVAQQVFDNLPAGSYVITESLPAGWGQVSATCDNGAAPGSLTLDPGEQVICSFVNAQLPGVLVVRKTTVGGDGTFSFSSPQVGDFSLTTTGGAAAQSFPNLAPGVYGVTEAPAAGWQQTGATCDNGDDPASVTIDPGETVTCTFTSTKLGSITIVKVAENGNGVFSFTSQTLGNFTLATAGSLFRGTAQRTFADLAAGTYDVAEQPATGWIFVSAACSDGSAPAAIDLAAGEDITCTFTNRPEPTALEEVNEPDLFNRMFLPMINR